MDRDSRKTLVALAIAVVGIAAVITIFEVTSKAGTDETKGVDLPTPHTIVKAGVRYTVGHSAVNSVVVDPTDPRDLTVYVEQIDLPDDPGCASLNPSVRVSSENGTTVTLAAFAYRGKAKKADKDGRVYCAYGSVGAGSSSPYAALHVRLKKALGERRVVDSATHQTIGMLSATYAPTPTYVPAGGYHRTLLQHFNPQDDFIAIDQYSRKADSIEIRVRSRTAWVQSGTVLGTDEVGGAKATVTEEDYERCVSWTPRTGLISEVCSLSQDPASYLPAATLLKIARSVPAPQ